MKVEKIIEVLNRYSTGVLSFKLDAIFLCSAACGGEIAGGAK